MADTFAIDVGRWVDKASGRMDLIVRKVSLEMFTRVVLRSPVDTGRFRGNWQVGIAQIPDGVLELGRGTTEAAVMNRITAATAGVKAGDIINLVNNLPYAAALERGWSKQAPAGMVGVTITEFQDVVQAMNLSVQGSS